jgi:polyhydroxybutyrate depolymerase
MISPEPVQSSSTRESGRPARQLGGSYPEVDRRARRSHTGYRVSWMVWLTIAASLLACARLGQASAPTLSPSGPSGGLTAGTYTRSLSVSGRERSYLVHVPGTLAAAKPAPVVLILHGGGGNAQSVEEMSNYDAESDASGFLAVYPNGTGRLQGVLLTWNAGTCCGYAQSEGVDDVEFIRAVIEDLAGLTPIDRHRIYATGMSNGAIMSYRLACELSDEIAAIAPVSGTLNVEPCLPGRPLSVIHFHGTADENVPYDGGIGDESISRVDFTSVQYTIDFWLDVDGCPDVPEADRSGDIIHQRFAPCDQGTAVELYTVVGGGHAWPGGSKPRGAADTPTQQISATHLSWEFFEANPLP